MQERCISIELLSIFVAKLLALKLYPENYLLPSVTLDIQVQATLLLIVAGLKTDCLAAVVVNKENVVVDVRVHFLWSRGCRNFYASSLGWRVVELRKARQAAAEIRHRGQRGYSAGLANHRRR